MALSRAGVNLFYKPLRFIAPFRRKSLRKKDIFVILAFHAHEPLWDLPGGFKNWSRIRK
jgi:hypothetical protein